MRQIPIWAATWLVIASGCLAVDLPAGTWRDMYLPIIPPDGLSVAYCQVQNGSCDEQRGFVLDVTADAVVTRAPTGEVYGIYERETHRLYGAVLGDPQDLSQDEALFLVGSVGLMSGILPWITVPLWNDGPATYDDGSIVQWQERGNTLNMSLGHSITGGTLDYGMGGTMVLHEGVWPPSEASLFQRDDRGWTPLWDFRRMPDLEPAEPLVPKQYASTPKPSDRVDGPAPAVAGEVPWLVSLSRALEHAMLDAEVSAFALAHPQYVLAAADYEDNMLGMATWRLVFQQECSVAMITLEYPNWTLLPLMSGKSTRDDACSEFPSKHGRTMWVTTSLEHHFQMAAPYVGTNDSINGIQWEWPEADGAVAAPVNGRLTYAGGGWTIILNSDGFKEASQSMDTLVHAPGPWQPAMVAWGYPALG